MSQQCFPSFDSALLVRDAQGRYLPATADQILKAAREAVDQKMARGTAFTSPEIVREYLTMKLSGFDYEVFAILFLDSGLQPIEYIELFRGTVNSVSVYTREVISEALRCNAVSAIISHNLPSGSPEPSGADKALTTHLKKALASGGGLYARSYCRLRPGDGIVCRTGASAPFFTGYAFK